MKNQINESLNALVQEYEKRTPNSKAAMANAARSLAGGDTRFILLFSPYPFVVESAKGSALTDIDGNTYRDFINDYSAGLYGHSEPVIQQAIIEVVRKGINLGTVTRYESQLADILVERYPALEKVRFTNSGTEANMMAFATARVYTGREKIMVMRGGWHGNALNFSEATDRSNTPFDFIYGTYNDLQETEQAIVDCSSELAAIVVEPMLGAGGSIPADQDFLQGLRDIADRTGAILIFDEVITSRMRSQGGQGIYGIIPDMMTCGKYLGGSGAFGAFGGREEIMALFQSGHPKAISHGGTFNNDVITMAAGLAGLRDVYTPEVSEKFFRSGTSFAEDLRSIAADVRVSIQITGMGTVMSFHFSQSRINTYTPPTPIQSEALAILHMAMLERGAYMARRGSLTLSLANTQEDIGLFKTSFSDVLVKYSDIFNEVAKGHERIISTFNQNNA